MATATRPPVSTTMTRAAALVLCTALLSTGLVTTAGCKSGPPENVVERAQLITKLKRRGLDLLSSLAQEEVSNYSDPRDSEDTLETLAEATDCFQQAVDLDPFSSEPRMRLARCHHLTGLIHLSNWVIVTDRINSRKTRGESESAELATQAAGYRKEAEEAFGRSIREYNYYLNQIMARYPTRVVYDRLFENYVILENWDMCASVLQQLLDQFGERMQAKEVDAVRNLIQQYEEKASMQGGGASG